MMAPEIVVPDDLRERDQWVLWRHEERNGKGTKVPYQVSGRRASSIDPGTWTSFEAVTNEWRRNPSRYAGLGFVFSASDPFCGIDLDDSLDADANVKPWARGIVERFGDTYMEISPSGAGLKIWVRGAVPANLPGVRIGDGQIEIYDHARYFAVTGRVFRDAPLEIEDHATDVQLCTTVWSDPRNAAGSCSPSAAGESHTVSNIARWCRSRELSAGGASATKQSRRVFRR